MEIKSLHTSDNIEIRKFGYKAFYLNKLQKSGIKIPRGLIISVQKNEFSILQNDLKKNKFVYETNLFSLRSSSTDQLSIKPRTILGIGLNESFINSFSSEKDILYFYKMYIKLIEEFSFLIFGLKSEIFENISDHYLSKKNDFVRIDQKINFLKIITLEYKKIFYNHVSQSFSDDKLVQLKLALNFFKSYSKNTIDKFDKFNINNEKVDFMGIIIQELVTISSKKMSGFGCYNGLNSSTGIEEEKLEFEKNFNHSVTGYLKNNAFQNFETTFFKKIKKDLKKLDYEVSNVLKDKYKLDFYYHGEDIAILDVSVPKRSTQATFKILVDLVNEGFLNKEEAVLKINPLSFLKFLHPRIDLNSVESSCGRGLSASPGAAKGYLAFNNKHVSKLQKLGKKVILVRSETSSKDVQLMHTLDGIITIRGGLTSHAAVIARGLGLPCIVGLKDFKLNYKKKVIKTFTGKKLNQGDLITIDGTSGYIFSGDLNLIPPKSSSSFEKIMKMVDKFKNLEVRANAETKKDIKIAKKFSSDGIGLCRTENMFLEKKRLSLLQKIILNNEKIKNKKFLGLLLKYHQNDLKILFETNGKKPFAVRLLDPPLRDFFPNSKKDIKVLIKKLSIKRKNLNETIKNIKEVNPMLGKRGIRLGLTEIGIYEMQISAIFGALTDLKLKKNELFLPEIIIPMVSSVEEVRIIKKIIMDVKKSFEKKYNIDLNFKFGVMIETPRLALISKEIAKLCDFFSYGTNDLTQLMYGLSRDDKGQFIRRYVEKNIFSIDPFSSIDVEGVGKIIIDSKESANGLNHSLKFGICGEHGGDPASVDFFSKHNFDFVSCSPFRIPIAKLASAQFSISSKNNKKE